MALVTPFKYPSSVEVTVDTATLPLLFDTRALLTVKLEEVIVEAPPVIVEAFPFN
jgi:hypothetical protein